LLRHLVSFLAEPRSVTGNLTILGRTSTFSTGNVIPRSNGPLRAGSTAVASPPDNRLIAGLARTSTFYSSERRSTSPHRGRPWHHRAAISSIPRRVPHLPPSPLLVEEARGGFPGADHRPRPHRPNTSPSHRPTRKPLPRSLRSEITTPQLTVLPKRIEDTAIKPTSQSPEHMGSPHLAHHRRHPSHSLRHLLARKPPPNTPSPPPPRATPTH